jgi:CRISPR-associated protein Cmr5
MDAYWGAAMTQPSAETAEQPTDTRNLEQRRAAYALKQLQGVVSRPGDGKDKRLYRSYVEGFPATILMNGLGQALAMLLAKGKQKANDPHMWLYEHLQSWLCGKEPGAKYPRSECILLQRKQC